MRNKKVFSAVAVLVFAVLTLTAATMAQELPSDLTPISEKSIGGSKNWEYAYSSNWKIGGVSITKQQVLFSEYPSNSTHKIEYFNKGIDVGDKFWRVVERKMIVDVGKDTPKPTVLVGRQNFVPAIRVIWFYLMTVKEKNERGMAADSSESVVVALAEDGTTFIAIRDKDAWKHNQFDKGENWRLSLPSDPERGVDVEIIK